MEQRRRPISSLPPDDSPSIATLPSSSSSSSRDNRNDYKPVGRPQEARMQQQRIKTGIVIVWVAAIGLLCCIHQLELEALHINEGRSSAGGAGIASINGVGRSASSATTTTTQPRTTPKQSLRNSDSTSNIIHRNDHVARKTDVQILHSNSNNTQTKTKRRPLRFVWHVGVMKTGTTSLQTGLAAQRSLLQQDGWVFVSQSDEQFQKIKQPDFVERFAKAMREYHRQGQNVVLSNENFSVFYRADDYQKIAEILVGENNENWDVTVVIGYRPYLEWIPSMWAQTHKLTRKEQRQSGDTDAYTWTNRPAVPPVFPDYYRKLDRGPLFADSALQFVQEAHFAPEQIQLLHLYDPQGLHVKFTCDILQAPRACDDARRQHEQEKHRVANQQGSLHPLYANAVATAAVREGLVDPERFARLSVIQAIVAHYEEQQQQQQPSNNTTTTTNDTSAAYEWPMVCPKQDDLERVWQQTLAKEAEIFPSLMEQDPDRTAHLRERFEAKIAQQSYCSVDAERVLRDWKEFFREQFA